MIFDFEQRPSDSSFVDRIWRTHSECAGNFSSLAVSHWEMVVMRYQGKTTLTVRGPETKATPANCPAQAEFLGIVFQLGTFMPHLPVGELVDGAVNQPDATSISFWMQGSAWQFPNFENADTFVARLVRKNLLGRDAVVEAVLQGQAPALSARSVERHFQRATGLTQGAHRQIERARHATILLQHGVSIAEVVGQAGYADQSHLTRSLSYFIGQTPAQIVRKGHGEELSFLFKTRQFP